jgi:uncharacterized protein YggE
MSRTIAVTGTGSLRVKPDQAEIALELQAKDMDYQRSVALSSEQLEEITQALAEVGFSKEDLKTSAFQVRAEYRGEHDEKGGFIQVFDGYVCHCSMKLCFDLDMQLLGETISAIGSCRARPELNIRFTVKEPEAVNAKLLKAAADNARSKAELLCAASGVELGQLQRIEYNWKDTQLYSRTAVNADRAVMPMMKSAFRAEMTPEDIELSDSAAFVWEIC